MSRGPLSGIKVLDCSIIYAGPYAGLHLADLGADVVKLERPSGDPFRHNRAVVPENSKVFQYLNRGKRSLVIDLHNQAGRALLQRIVPDYDVVLHNYRPGVPQRLGIDYEALSALRPDLIYAEVSGFGAAGPLADRPGSNIVAEAYGGAMAMGEKIDADGAPMRTGVTMADLPTGIALALGICAALLHRERTGEGQVVTTSLLRSVLSQTGMFNMREPVTDAAVRDPLMEEVAALRAKGAPYQEVLAARVRYHSTLGGPFQSGFRVKDGAIVLGALTPANRAAAQAVLGIDESPEDEQGASDLVAQRARVEEVRRKVRDILLGDTQARWLERFAAAGVPAAPVNLPEDLLDDPQGASHFVAVEHEQLGTQQQAGPIVELSRSPAEIASAAPTLGRHTDEVLREHQVGPAELDELRRRGAIG